MPVTVPSLSDAVSPVQFSDADGHSATAHPPTRNSTSRLY